MVQIGGEQFTYGDPNLMLAQTMREVTFDDDGSVASSNIQVGQRASRANYDRESVQ